MKYFFAILFCVGFFLFGQDDVLSEIDSLLSFSGNDFSGKFTFVKDIPGVEQKDIQVVQIYRRDSENKYTVLILEPQADRGKGYLQVNNNLWVYDPISRRFNRTSARDRFQNYPFRTSDFSQSTLAQDYEITATENATISGMNLRVLDLKAKDDSVPFAQKKIWVNEDNLVIKIIDYSFSGQALRTILIPKYKKLGDSYVAVNIVIVDNLTKRSVGGRNEYEKTTITIENISDNDVPDSYYTQAYLEREGN